MRKTRVIMDKTKAISLIQERHSLNEIASQLNVTRQTVHLSLQHFARYYMLTRRLEKNAHYRNSTRISMSPDVRNSQIFCIRDR